MKFYEVYATEVSAFSKVPVTERTPIYQQLSDWINLKRSGIPSELHSLFGAIKKCDGAHILLDELPFVSSELKEAPMEVQVIATLMAIWPTMANFCMISNRIALKDYCLKEEKRSQEVLEKPEIKKTTNEPEEPHLVRACLWCVARVRVPALRMSYKCPDCGTDTVSLVDFKEAIHFPKLSDMVSNSTTTEVKDTLKDIKPVEEESKPAEEIKPTIEWYEDALSRLKKWPELHRLVHLIPSEKTAIMLREIADLVKKGKIIPGNRYTSYDLSIALQKRYPPVTIAQTLCRSYIREVIKYTKAFDTSRGMYATMFTIPSIFGELANLKN